MFRFKMPDMTLPIREQAELLKEQFNSFIKSDALSDILSILDTNLNGICVEYNARVLKNGKVREIQEIGHNDSLDDYRNELYHLFKELGLLGINKPLTNCHSHIIVLGGSFNSCHVRTSVVKDIIDDSTLFIDGLACYRPINPVEKVNLSPNLSCDTEFATMTEAFIHTFSLKNANVSEDFVSDRNINSISNIRTFKTDGNLTYRIMAAPSGEPDKRRANTADTLKFYMDNTTLDSTSSVIATTNNLHCNRQFIQLTYEMLKSGRTFNIDVVGCSSDDRIKTIDEYNPYQFVQELIATIDWINKFNDDSTTWN